MTHQALPRPATDLFPESLNLSPRQRSVLDVFDNFPDGARVGDIAHALNMHVNTARGHLDELVERGAIISATAPSQGRGRPSLIYKLRVPDNRVIANEYLTLISVMSEHLATASPIQSRLIAKRIGKDWGQRMMAEGFSADTIAEAVASLSKHFREMGFDPIIVRNAGANDEVHMCLHTCPFVTKTGQLVNFACEIHQGMLEHQRDSSPLKIVLDPLRADGECHLSISNQTS